MTVARILRARVAGRKFSSLRPPPLFLGANWKCSLEDAASVDALVDDLNAMRRADDGADGGAQLELCVNPPHVFLDRVRARLDARVRVGAQHADARANTGATTAAMLKAVGVDWVLLGHSDRRNVLGEGDALIAAAAAECLAAGLGINLTLGETAAQRAAGDALPTLRRQLAAAAAAVPSARDWARVVLAYEPVWAIGPGATPCEAPEAQRVCGALRQWVREHAGDAAAASCRVAYTGSVSEENARGYAALADVDGFVVGRAGLDASKLGAIARALVETKRTRSGQR